MSLFKIKSILCQHTILQPIHTVRTSSDLAMQGRLKNNFRKTKIKNKAKLLKMSFLNAIFKNSFEKQFCVVVFLFLLELGQS